MKILLLGEYSNVHWTLAQGLRALGEEVTVVSDGDEWKDYKRDINLQRHSLSAMGTAKYLLQVVQQMRSWKNYDVVQIINPIFLSLKANKIAPFYNYIRKHNKKVFLGAFGMDHYWVKAGLDCKTFRYSDFNLGSEVRHSAINDIWINDWLNGDKGKLNRMIAQDCDGIISGLYEYDCSYRPFFSKKLCFIPFPINTDEVKGTVRPQPAKVRFFIGIQKSKSAYKGTDIMLSALEKVKAKYPDGCEIVKAESVPFPIYQNMMENSDALLDQLYSYTPAMNALHAMAKGLVLVGGGEPEAYDLLGDKDLRPIVNVLPNEDSVFKELENLVLHPELIPRLSQNSIQMIERYHNYKKVAQKYLDFWQKTSGKALKNN